MSDKELKLKGDQNFDDLRDVWERIEALEKDVKATDKLFSNKIGENKEQIAQLQKEINIKNK